MKEVSQLLGEEKRDGTFRASTLGGNNDDDDYDDDAGDNDDKGSPPVRKVQFF